MARSHYPLAVRIERLVDEMGVGVHENGQAVRIGKIGDDDLWFGPLPPLPPRAVPVPCARDACAASRHPAMLHDFLRAQLGCLRVLRARVRLGFPGCIRLSRVIPGACPPLRPRLRLRRWGRPALSGRPENGFLVAGCVRPGFRLLHSLHKLQSPCEGCLVL